MKRLLSIILTLSMLAVFVPAVSAADAVQPNFTIKYDVGGMMTTYNMQKPSNNATTVHMDALGYNHTNGFFAYSGASTALSSGLWAAEYQTYTSTVEMKSASGWIAFKIQVPVEGIYKLEVNHDNAKNGGYVDIYIDNDRKGSYSCYGTAATYFGDAKRNVNDIIKSVNDDGTLGGEATFSLTAGEHTIKFANRANTAVSGAERASIGTFKLISGDGNGNAIVAGSIVEPFELDTLTDPTKELSVSGYLSSTCEAIETFTYSSSPVGVVDISEAGVVTAVGAGTATITASANAINSLTTTVTVTETDPTAYAVTYDISGIMAKYTMRKNTWGTTLMHMPAVGYHHTNGFFKYNKYTSHTIAGGKDDGITYEAWTHKTMALNRAGSYLSFDIQVPEDGNYKMQMNHDLSNRGGYIDVYVDSTKYGSYNCYDSTKGADFAGARATDIIKTDNGDGTLGDEAVIPLTKGEHTVTFATRTVDGRYHGSVGTFKLIKGGSDVAKVWKGYATVAYATNGVPVTTLTNGHVVDATAAVYNTDGTVAQAATTLESTDPSVLAVNGTKVTAVGQGKAKITAKVTYDGVPYTIESDEILVTDPAISSNTVSFYADASIDGITIETSIDGYTPGVIGSIPANTKVTLTAPTENIGDKVFRGWMRGSEDNGVWITTEPKLENVRLLTHTFFTAVYEEELPEDMTTVEFWNWNGQYLGSKEVEKGTQFLKDIAPKPHTLTGYTFSHWSVDDGTPITGVTNAVAQYTKIKENGSDEAKKYTVTVPDGVTGGGSYEFDTYATLTSENDVYWINNGKTVDYGKTYKFYVWDDTTIEVSDNGNKGPRVALHKHEAYGTYMLEYDKGDEANKSIIEAGILFGENANIGSFSSKATAKNLESHGQFTAVPYDDADKDAAVGYIIYLDGSIPRVLYAYEN